MKNIDHQDKEIFTEAEDWHSETVLSLHSQVKIYKIVGIISLCLSFLAVFSLTQLIPLKKTIPYVIEVNKITGDAKVLKIYSGKIENISFEETLSKYWINQYLIARESYYPNLDIEENYLKVQHLSEGKAFSEYKKRFSDGNPKNPFVKYADDLVRVKVLSISFLRKDTATIRYDLIRSTKTTETITRWIDILKFKYTKTPETEATMLENPLGFKITEYRIDSEMIE